MSSDSPRQTPVLGVELDAPVADPPGSQSARDAAARDDGGPVERPPRRLAAVRAAALRPHQLLPAALTAALALRAGGYFPAETALFAVAMALLLLARFTLADRPFAGWSPALAASTGALGLLAGWTLLSALWSDAPLRAMLEFDRVLAYVLLVAFMGSFAARSGDLDRVLRWVALVIGALAAAALLTRLYPATFPTAAGASPSRLAFPLTYYNALGVFCAVGMVLALHCTAGARQRPLARILGAGALPVLAVALYFTLSRGAIAAAAAGVLAYVVLAHPRRLPSALLAAALPVALAVRAAYRADGLVTVDFARFTAEAEEVARWVAACAAGAMALRGLLLLADARLDRIRVTPRARRIALLTAAAVGVTATVAAAIALDAPRRAEDAWQAVQRSDSTGQGGTARDRLTGLSGHGRVAQWRVSIDAFEREPLTGTGAGTYRLEWDRERPSPQNVTDGHSLYLEVLAELGWPGLALLLVGLLVPLAVGVRGLFGPERTAHAAFLGGALALLLHAGLDWDWEMPALFAWYFGAAGLVCASRAGGAWQWRPARLTRVLAGLACLLLALSPLSVAASQRPLDAGTAAFKGGDCAGAVDGALDSLDALNVRPEPFELLGYCNLRAGREDLAVQAFESARARDPEEWQYAYGLAVAHALDGRDPRPMARLARRLNPRDARTRALASALRRGGPRRWARAAARALVPFR